LDINEIEILLATETGLAPESIGRRTIEAAVSRAASHFLMSEQQYSELLVLREKEFEQLIEEITVPETWFFRDRGPFDYLKKFIITKRLLYPAKVRILSAPCSTGEEPYSIAISLFEAGLPTDRFSIDALDISKKNIEKAKEGSFGKASFRPFIETFVYHYFKEKEGNYFINNNIKNQINFFHSNILKEDFLSKYQYYDVIFCKNLLIYLNEDARLATITKLRQLLKPDGVLFAGHTEIPIFTTQGFSSVKEPRSFALVKSNHSNNIKKTKEFIFNAIAHTHPNPKQRPAIKKEKSETKQIQKINEVLSPPLTQTVEEKDTLYEIQRLADSGSIIKAKEECSLYIKKFPGDANGFYLMGVLCNAINDVNFAAEYFEKALYLEPNHYDALVNLSLIFGLSGNYDKEKIYKERARKVYEKNH